jgi:hypothetical protein
MSALSDTGAIVEHSIGLNSIDEDLQAFRQVLAEPFAAKVKQQRSEFCLVVLMQQTQEPIQILVFGTPEGVYFQQPRLSCARHRLRRPQAAGDEDHQGRQRSYGWGAHRISLHSRETPPHGAWTAWVFSHTPPVLSPM